MLKAPFTRGPANNSDFPILKVKSASHHIQAFT